MKANITPADLSSLSKEDLKSLGIQIEKHQDELLKAFSQLPKQRISFDK